LPSHHFKALAKLGVAASPRCVARRVIQALPAVEEIEATSEPALSNGVIACVTLRTAR